VEPQIGRSCPTATREPRRTVLRDRSVEGAPRQKTVQTEFTRRTQEILCTINHYHIRFLHSVRRLLVTANVRSSLILVALMMEALCFSEKHRFLQEPRCVKSQSTALLIVTAVKTSNLNSFNRLNSVAERQCVSCGVRTGVLYTRRRHSS
jgi:hypothetical protein